jgi:diphthamide biosynthesis protein 7
MHLSIDTILPADSVEFCPHPDASNVFVCGTYQLQDEQSPAPISPSSGPATGQTQIRTGQCLVYEVHSEQEEINVCETLTTAVVLCMRPLKLRTTVFQL